MVEAVVLTLCTWISLIDIRSHRIPNRLTLILAIILLFDSESSGFYASLTAVLATLLISYLGKIGAGDVKLFLVLAATSGSLVLTQRYFLYMLLISTSSLLASLVSSYFKGLERQRAIAFAPSILIPFLILYLAI